MYSSDSGNKNLIIEHVVEIANALDGKTEATTTAPKTGSRIRDALGRIADYFEANPGGGRAELPTVSSTDNGSVLRVVNGAWAKGTNELPAVSATNNGMVLKVVNGAWAVASVESPDDTQPSG